MRYFIQFFLKGVNLLQKNNFTFDSRIRRLTFLKIKQKSDHLSSDIQTKTGSLSNNRYTPEIEARYFFIQNDKITCHTSHNTKISDKQSEFYVND